MAAPGEDPPPGEPGIELDRIQAECNSVRLHAAIGYVTRRRARRPRRSDPPGPPRRLAQARCLPLKRHIPDRRGNVTAQRGIRS
jgi:hypothetical protein